MPQQSVARPGERRAEKEQKEIERHCPVECRGPWPGKGFGTEEMDWRAFARQGVAHGLVLERRKKHSAMAELAHGRRFGKFWSLANGTLDCSKSRVPWLDWLVDIAKRRGGGLGEF